METVKILITGGNGFLGSNLVNKISKRNYILHLLIREKSDISRLKLNKKIKLLRFKKKNLENLFKKNKYDMIIHCATNYGIEEDNYRDYFNSSNHIYNIVSQEIIEKVSEEIGKDAEPFLRFLNFVSIRRKEANSNNFENIGYLLLTGNTTTLKVAWNELLKEDGYVPMASHLNFLTNKFWFKLNKGFGKTSLPKSFDIITKSQIILSKVLNDNVGGKFAEFQSEYKKGKLTEEQAKARIIDLRNQVRKPEEIKNDVVNDVLNAITEDSLEKFIQEQSHFKSKAEKQEKDNIKLLDELESKKNIEKQFLKSREDLLNDKIKLNETLDRQKKTLDKKAWKKYKTFKTLLGSAILGYYVLLIGSIFYFTWNVMEQYTFILSIVPIIISILYFFATEQTFNPLNYLKIQEENYLKQTYLEFDFDIDKLTENQQEMNNLNAEIVEIRNASN
jgi:hypothetical protein